MFKVTLKTISFMYQRSALWWGETDKRVNLLHRWKSSVGFHPQLQEFSNKLLNFLGGGKYLKWSLFRQSRLWNNFAELTCPNFHELSHLICRDVQGSSSKLTQRPHKFSTMYFRKFVMKKIISIKPQFPIQWKLGQTLYQTLMCYCHSLHE